MRPGRPGMIKSPVAWLLAVALGVVIHIDWHLGRPGHHSLSFDLSYHWVLAVPTFAALAWIILRRWPTHFARASMGVILAGVFLGQGLEPLGEIIHSGGAVQPFSNPVRWRVFGEFIVAGGLTYLATAFALRRRGGK